VERYDAKRALMHPFITRKLEDKIPLTKGEEMNKIDIEVALRKMTLITTFISIVKKFNDSRASLGCSSFTSLFSDTNQPLSSSYLEKIKF
jgi:hypothetical protein